MNRLKQKAQTRLIRERRVRATVSGTNARPRLAVRISNYHVSAQIIDDLAHHTLLQVTTVGQKNAGGSLSEKAAWAGQTIAKAALSKKIKKVVLDRGNRIYHGRVKALAEAARAAGLEF